MFLCERRELAIPPAAAGCAMLYSFNRCITLLHERAWLQRALAKLPRWWWWWSENVRFTPLRADVFDATVVPSACVDSRAIHATGDNASLHDKS